VTIGRDMGQTIDISAGIQPGDKVIDSPPEDLIAGDTVQVAAPEKAKPASGKGNG
jgi:hypothetical protein